MNNDTSTLTEQQLQVLRACSKDEQAFAQLVQLFLNMRADERQAHLPEPSGSPPEPDESSSTAPPPTRPTTLTFLNAISYEIRPPLYAVLGMVGLLLEADLTPEQREYTETVRTAIWSMRNAIDTVLDYLRIESGNFELEHTPFDLRACIEDAVNLTIMQAVAKNLDLIYYVEDHVPVEITGDMARLCQIIVNLLNNAVKFTETGEVILSVDAHPISSTRYDIQVLVRDTGIGIPPERLENLFHPLARDDVYGLPTHNLTGLGLAISRQLAKLMGGTIEVTSVPGQGSSFRITFEAEAVSRPLPDYLQPNHPLLAGQHVLILDHNPTNREIVARRLKTWGMLPWAEQSLSRALEQLQQGRLFDLALIDTTLPEVQDLTLLHALSQYYHAEFLPLVLLTPTGSRADIEQRIGHRVAAVLSRPARVAHLFDALVDICMEQPARATIQTKKTAVDPQMAQRHPLRILLVDDNPMNQQMSLIFLEQFGYQADVATNGLEALAIMRAVPHQPYDIIFMDIQMPEMDGIEATRRIRADWPASEQPCIIGLSAMILEGDPERYRDAGMDYCLSKSVSLEEFGAVLEECLQAGRRQEAEEPAKPLPPSPVTPPAAPALEPERTPSPGRGTPPPIDQRVFERLRQTIGSDEQQKLAELVSIFIAHTDKFFHDLEQAAAQDNTESLQYMAHTLKSSSASLGAMRLSRLCRELELACHANDVALAKELASQVSDELHKVHQALEDIRNREG